MAAAAAWVVPAIISGLGLAWGFMSGQKQYELADKQYQMAKKQAAANAEISRQDAALAEEKARRYKYLTGVQAQRQLDKVGKFLAVQKTSYAAAGVRVSSGSAIDVQNETYRRGMQDYEMILYNGRTAEAEALSLAARYRKLADAGLRDAAAQAMLTHEAAMANALNTQMTAGINFAKDVYNIGMDAGWWGTESNT